ncbi:MAG TPA: beta-ketoacyl-ACP synthase II [Steroidobacteraceae bacterium]|nr:beta-ketoacyl-ACP synthase II [Steroidobacteraceae bacterium]
MTKRRVVVTGLGIVSPVGSQVAEAWDNVVNGRSYIGPIGRFDVSNYPTRFAGDVRGFNVEEYLEAKEARRMDGFLQYGFAAATQALKDSGLEVTAANAPRIGVAMGAGIGGLDTIQINHVKLLEAKGPRKVSPFFVPACIINMISGHVSIRYGLKGPNLALATACTTSTHTIGIAARTIQYGDADAMLAGGAEMAITPLAVAGFCQAKALSERNDDPTRASRPWDRDRDGFVMADGAGALMLEDYEHARARGATIYAEFAGLGMSGDAHHITAPPEDGDGARLAMSNALNDAGVTPDALDYINAHATSTPLGDIAETVAIRRVLGSSAARVAISSTKSVTGHLLGAAGAVEALFSILAIRDQVAPPTINLENPDPKCDLDYVPNTARKMKIEVALSNSFGFGGTNGSLVFRRLR